MKRFSGFFIFAVLEIAALIFIVTNIKDADDIKDLMQCPAICMKVVGFAYNDSASFLKSDRDGVSLENLWIVAEFFGYAALGISKVIYVVSPTLIWVLACFIALCSPCLVISWLWTPPLKDK